MASSRVERLELSSPSVIRTMALRTDAVSEVFQPLATGVKDRIVKPRAVTGTQAAYALREQLRIAGEFLRDLKAGIETQHERLIVLGPDGLVHELNRGFLLELEAAAD